MLKLTMYPSGDLFDVYVALCGFLGFVISVLPSLPDSAHLLLGLWSQGSKVTTTHMCILLVGVFREGEIRDRARGHTGRCG